MSFTSCRYTEVGGDKKLKARDAWLQNAAAEMGMATNHKKLIFFEPIKMRK